MGAQFRDRVVDVNAQLRERACSIEPLTKVAVTLNANAIRNAILDQITKVNTVSRSSCVARFLPLPIALSPLPNPLKRPTKPPIPKQKPPLTPVSLPVFQLGRLFAANNACNRPQTASALATFQGYVRAVRDDDTATAESFALVGGVLASVRCVL